MDIRPFESDSNSTEAAGVGEPAEVLIPKKFVVAGVGVVLLVFLTWSGHLSRGYDSKTISFSSFSRASSGSSFGPKRMFLRKGQTFTADYDVEVERGGLTISLRKCWDVPPTPAVGRVRVQRSESGQLRVSIPETGVYQLWIRGSSGRDGYHVSYTVSWRTGWSANSADG